MTVYILNVGRVYRILKRDEIISSFYSLLEYYPLNKFSYELTDINRIDKTCLVLRS